MLALDVQESDVVAKAKELGPLVQSHAKFAEDNGRLHDEVVDAFQQSGLYSINVPDEYGGTSPSPRAQCEAIIELAKWDATASWCFMVSTGFNWQVGHDFTHEIKSKAFRDVSAHVAGSFMPAFFATPVEGGYQVSGQSKFNSNNYRSGYKFVMAILNDGQPMNLEGGEIPPLLAMLVPDKDCEIVPNWDVMGLVGTGSHDLAMEDVFVPTEHTSDIVRSVHKKPQEFTNPIYRLPYIPWTGFHTAAVLIGIAEAAYEGFVNHTTSKIMLTNKLQSQATLPSTKFTIAEVATKVRAAKAHLLFTADEIWQVALSGREYTATEEAEMQMASYHTSALSVEAVKDVFTVSGAAAIFKDMPLEKHMRDVLTAQQHLSVSPHRSLAAISRRLLGLPLESNQPFD